MTRADIAASAASHLREAAALAHNNPVVVGFDGFVDEIVTVVEKRHSASSFDPVPTIARLAEKMEAAVGQSSNYELVVKDIKIGGNGPIMANAMAAAGLPVTYLGSLGYPEVHPVFHQLAQRATVYTIGQPGHTDALEFADGKLMLGKIECLNDVTWDNLVNRVGLDQLRTLFGAAKLIGTVNWTMLPEMGGIWEGIQRDILAHDPTRRVFFCDLADPEKRTRESLIQAMERLTAFQTTCDVILGLNLKEAVQVAEALEVPIPDDLSGQLTVLAANLRNRLGLTCVVIHPRAKAAAATENETVEFLGPYIAEPKISTGGGDHFNAGFCVGWLLGLPLVECLATGKGTSGSYVRTAESPTVDVLAEFLENLPDAQPIADDH